MDWKPATKLDGKIEIPSTYIYLRYYDAINVLFRVENALRMFVYIILKSNHFEHWQSLNIASDEGKDLTILAATSQRRTQDEVYGYLGFPATCPLLYLTSGELIRLIIAETNWKYFRPYFTASKEIVKTKLDEIGNVRNSLAHFRPLREEDVGLVKQNALHVLQKVEGCLKEVLECEDVVPTNLDEPWYKGLSVIGSDLCRLSFSQSHDANWIKLHLSYACRVIQATKLARSRVYKLTTVRTPAILNLWPVIRNAVIFVNEKLPYFKIVKDEDQSFSKTITLTFAKKALADKHEEIAGAITSLLEKLNEETELVKNDHLARGRLVYAISVSAHLKSVNSDQTLSWGLDVRGLRERDDSTDAPEYLGSLDSMQTEDFITDSRRFAWMPVDVSDYDSIPF